MNTIQAGFQGATPELAVKPVDPALPVCGKVIAIPAFESFIACTRKQGHYGPCGVAK